MHTITPELIAELEWLRSVTQGKAAIRPVLENGFLVGTKAEFEVVFEGRDYGFKMIAPTMLGAIQKFRGTYAVNYANNKPT